MTEEKRHERTEVQNATAVLTKSLGDYHEFRRLKAFGRIKATREVNGKLATEADQDRGACRASRACHHLPAGRTSRHRPDGTRRPRGHAPVANATVMRVTTIQAETERNWLDRFKAPCKTSLSGQTAVASRSDPPSSNSFREQRRRLGRKCLSTRQRSSDLHVRQHTTWGMSVEVGLCPA